MHAPNGIHVSLDAVYDSVSGGHCVVGRDGIVRSVSRKCLGTLQSAEADIAGRPVGGIFRMVNGAGLPERLAVLASRGTEFSPDSRRVRTLFGPDESAKTLDLMVLPAPPDGPMVLLVFDMTEKVVLDEQFRIVNSRLKTLIASINAGILFENEHRRVIVVNEEFCRMFQFSSDPARLLGRQIRAELPGVADLFVESDSFWGRTDLVVGERRKVIGEELTLINGRTYERDYIPILIDDAYSGHLWVYHDVTERKTNEQRIQQLARFPEEDPSPVLRIDANLKVIYANQSAKTMLREMGNGVAVEVSSEMRQYVETALDTARTLEVELQNHVTAAWYLCTVVPFRESGYVNLYVRDITERKRAEEAIMRAKRLMEQSMRTKQEFTSRMNHELRTPLNAIIGFADIVAGSDLTPEQAEFVGNIKRSGELLLSLVNDVLDLAKIESGKVELTPLPFELPTLLEQVRTSLLPQCRAKGIGFSVELRPDVPAAVVGAERQIHQVLLNLCSNAVKFTESGSVRIAVSVKERNDAAVTVAVDVIDTGRGIPRDKQHLLFSSFTQLHEGRANLGGTGLGLTIVKNLVTLMGGTVAVKSEEGKGSVFTLLLPLQTASAREIVRKPPEERTVFAPFDGSFAVLVAEDNQLNQIIIRNILQQWGIAADVANNGQEAIHMLGAKPYDCLILDIQMDIMDGYETARAVRTSMPAPVSRIPIIAMTAFVSEEIEQQARECGMDHYVTKPFDKAVVHRLLKEIAAAAKKEGRSVPAPVPLPAAPADTASVHTEPPAAGPEPISMEQIRFITGGNPAYTAIFLKTFITELPGYSDRLDAAASAYNEKEMLRIEHSLKPTWGYFGQTTMKGIVHDLAGKVKRREPVAEDLARFRRLIGIVVRRLEELREECGAGDPVA